MGSLGTALPPRDADGGSCAPESGETACAGSPGVGGLPPSGSSFLTEAHPQPLLWVLGPAPSAGRAW